MLQMEKLYISDVKLGDDGFTAIASCVTNIENLSIGHKNDTELTTKGIRALAQGILTRSKPVSYQQQVYFSYNEKFISVS